MFAGHRIEEVIGRGGASVVYLAEHLRLGRRVALKVLAPHLAEDETFRERFIRESRIAAALDHPNVVTIYDAGEVEDGLYISMRYVEGSDLGRILRAEGALEPARTILILAQVASGLDAAHAQGLVHRDVKPGNVLVESPGSPLERAYLADFGISKRTTTGSGLTRTGQFVGTIDYVAPEQITGEPIDGRTDVYSLGCVLFQCVAGRVPFHADTEVATIYRQLNDVPPPIEGVADSNGLNEVIAKALAKSKEDRFHSCGALIEAVRLPLADATAPPTVVRTIATAGDQASGAERDTDVLAEPRRRDPGSRRRSLWLSVSGVAVTAGIVGIVLLIGRGEPPGGTDPGAVTGAGSTGSTSTTPPLDGDPLRLTWSVVKERTLSGDQAMDDVVPTPGGLVAVGHVEGEIAGEDDAGIWVSSGPDRWHRSTSAALGGSGDQRALAVTEFGQSLVVGGWDDELTAVWSSPDAGSNWARSTSSDLGEGVIRDFVKVGATLFAVGGIGPKGDQDAAVWTSADGTEWTLSFQDEGLGDQQIWSVENLGGSMVAVGYTYVVGDSYDGAIWVMPTDQDWARVDPSMFAETGHQLMKAVIGGPDGLPIVVVGCEDTTWRCDLEGNPSDAAVWTSQDGETWTKAELVGDDLVGEGVQMMLSLSKQGGTIVAAGSATANTGDLDAMIWTSSDGRSWSPDLSRRFAIAPLGGAGDQAMRALTPFHRKGLVFIGVGVIDDGTDQDTMVWGGTS